MASTTKQPRSPRSLILFTRQALNIKCDDTQAIDYFVNCLFNVLVS